MAESRFIGALRELRAREVDFILVGGLAAVLNGAPMQTLDVDIVYAREPANRERLLRFLDAAAAIFRIQPERRLRPNASHLEGGGHLNLLTAYGPLDALGFIGGGLTYPDLLPASREMEVAEGVRVRVLNLETLIAVKESLGSEKDLAWLPLLRRTLAESRKAKP